MGTPIRGKFALTRWFPVMRSTKSGEDHTKATHLRRCSKCWIPSRTPTSKYVHSTALEQCTHSARRIITLTFPLTCPKSSSSQLRTPWTRSATRYWTAVKSPTCPGTHTTKRSTSPDASYFQNNSRRTVSHQTISL